MNKALILSVGTTPEPLAKSIANIQPSFVCFLASQDTVEKVASVKGILQQGNAWQTFQDYKVITDNPNDLVVCYRKALDCWGWLESLGMNGKDILVDFTGGTKVMSVTLALVGIAKESRFLYVGGLRDMKNRGIVITGFEDVLPQANPWELFAVEEQRRASSYFNEFQFSASANAFAQASARIKSTNKSLAALLRSLSGLATGYGLWDQFKHKEAVRQLGEAKDQLQAYSDISGERTIQDLLDCLEPNLTFLQTIVKDSFGGKQFCEAHLLDIMANAQRRASTDQYDEAAVRLYRALELKGQLTLQRLGISSDAVPTERVPAEMREDYISRYQDRETGKLKLPLEASYALLRALGDPVGQDFLAHKREFKGIQTARNTSWLIHGPNTIQRATYESLSRMLFTLTGIQESQLPVFPTLASP